MSSGKFRFAYVIERINSLIIAAAINPYLKMKMGRGCVARVADKAYNLTFVYGIAFNKPDFACVGIKGLSAVAVVDYAMIAETVVPFAVIE